MVVAWLGGEALRWGLGAYRHPLVDVYFFMSVLCEEEEVEKRWTDTRFIITRWPRNCYETILEGRRRRKRHSTYFIANVNK